MFSKISDRLCSWIETCGMMIMVFSIMLIAGCFLAIWLMFVFLTYISYMTLFTIRRIFGKSDDVIPRGA